MSEIETWVATEFNLICQVYFLSTYVFVMHGGIGDYNCIPQKEFGNQKNLIRISSIVHVNNILKTTRIILVRINGTKAILFTKNPCSFHKLLSGYPNSIK
jgi:hypothetical protein